MEKKYEQDVEMLVKFFNLTVGGKFQCHSEKNVVAGSNAIEATISRQGCDVQTAVSKIKSFIKEKGSNYNDSNGGFVALCNDYIDELLVTCQPKVEEPTPATKEVSLETSMAFMSSLISEMLGKVKSNEVQETVVENVKAEVREFIQKEYGHIEKKITLKVGEKKVELEGVLHSKFDTILNFVNANEPVYLSGPAGSGKNVICQQVAKALGLDFYFSNAVTQEYKITGFTDANGIFHESQFYKAFKNGGVFMLDEMDASIPEVLIILNAAIANRYFDFPAPIGYVEAHKDFRVIAAGNTFGAGADYDYVGRSQLDAASLDRFAMVTVDYDKKIEESCAGGNEDLLNFCRKFRKATKDAGIRTVVSYRAISRMAKLDSCMEACELLDTCLVKSLDVDDMNIILSKLDGCGKYTEGFTKLLNKKKSH